MKKPTSLFFATRRAAVLLASASLVLSACSRPASQDLSGYQEPIPVPAQPVYDKVAQPPAPEAMKVQGRITQLSSLLFEENNKLDILFVVDTSSSMCSDQTSIRNNINSFVNTFLENKVLDFHIGVTVTWDSQTYGDAARKYKNGELRPLKGIEGAESKPRFVTRQTPNLAKVLGNSLAVGFEPYIQNDPVKTGPEFEELFSPVEAVLSGQLNEGSNKGFMRPGAHFVVVFITDTDDSTRNLTASTLASMMEQLKTGKNTVSAFGALARYDEMQQFDRGVAPGVRSFAKPFSQPSQTKCENYAVDPMLVPAYAGPRKISELIDTLEGKAFDLSAAKFGEKFGEMSKQIFHRILNRKIALDRVPDINKPIVFKLNGKTVAQNGGRGWAYDSESQSIIYNGEIPKDSGQELKVEIEYSPF